VWAVATSCWNHTCSVSASSSLGRREVSPAFQRTGRRSQLLLHHLPKKRKNVYLPSLMMKVPNHLYVLGDTYTCHSYCCYAYYFMRIDCTLFTYDTYMCRLRLINDSVLSSLKMEGIRLFFIVFCLLLLSNGFNVDIGHTCNTMRVYHDTIMTCATADRFCSLVSNPPSTTRAPTHVLT
jgi:hypothetical protein